MSQWQKVNGILSNEEPKDPVLEKTENNQVKTEPTISEENGSPSAQQQSLDPTNIQSDSAALNNNLCSQTAMNNYISNRVHNLNAPDTTQPPVVEHHGKTRKRRERTVFTKIQTEALEDVFQNNTRYPDFDLRSKLSSQLQLTEFTVRIWFKNRRAKDRQQKQQQQPTIKARKEQKPLSQTTVPPSTEETPSKSGNATEGDLVACSICMQRTATAYHLTNIRVRSYYPQNHGLSSQYGNMAMAYCPQPNAKRQNTDV